ncbi:MAG: PAS domain S-box protein [Ignavibacteriaceae bacterium]|nr:PAS domain S-box protein [Ignavibacteriaceae bacterium]
MSDPVKLLLFDNNPANAEFIKDEISKLGVNFELDSCSDFNTFLDRIDDFSPAIILFNQKLSSFESLTALALLKKKNPGFPIIYLFSEEGDVRTIKSKLSREINKEDLAIITSQLAAILKGVEEQSQIKSLLFTGETGEARKSAEAGKTDHLLESILSSIPDLIAVIDSGGVVRQAFGESPESIFPSPETYRDKGVTEVFPESFLQVFRASVSEVLGSRHIVTANYAEVSEGEKIFIEVRFIPHRENQVIAVFRDITDQKANDLKFSFYSQVINNLDLAVITTDSDFKIYTWNNAAAQMYGFSENQVTGKNLGDVIPPSSDGRHFHEVREELLEKGMVNREIILSTPLGINHTVSSTLIALRNAKFKLIGVIEIDKDITDLKIVESKLRRENEKLKVLLEKIPDSLIVLQNARITQHNNSFPRMLGYHPEDLINTDFLSLVSSEDHDRVKNALRLSITEEVNLPAPGIKLLHKNGINKIFCSIILKPAGEIPGITTIGICKDITEEVGMDTILSESVTEETKYEEDTEDSKERDFRTYMNAILGFADILKENFKDLPDTDFFSYADEIYSSGNELLNLLDLYPELIVSGGKQIELNRVPISVTDITLKVINSLQHKAIDKNLKLNLINKSKLEVLADEKKLSHALTVLLENSIKYSYDSSITIESGFDLQRDAAFIKIKDTGLYLDEKFLPGLFKPIRKELEASSPVLYHSGMAFSSAKKLVEMMQGKFVIAVLPERGVMLTIYLDIEENSRNKLTQQSTTFYTVSPEVLFLSELQPSFLIVEDDPGSAKMLELTLKAFSNLEFASDGDTTLNTLAEKASRGESYDLILMDIGLPEPWDGISLRKEIIKRLPQYEKVPFLAETAFATTRDRDKIYRAGFTGYITKPIDRRYLIKTIANTLKKSLGLASE